MIKLDWEQAQNMKNFYVCSDCWGELEIIEEDDHYVARCKTSNCTTPALISIRAMNYRKRVSDEWAYLARMALRDAIPWLGGNREKKSEEQILYELGYKKEE